MVHSTFLLALLLVAVNANRENLFLLARTIISAQPPCPCSNVSWCNPIKTKAPKELVAFSANVPRSVWINYDWKHLTTLIVTDCVHLLNGTVCNTSSWDPQLVCHAHMNNVRVVRWPVHGYSADLLTNYTERYNWIKMQADIVAKRYWDGINLDWELPIKSTDKTSQLLLTEFVNDVSTVFRIMNPGAQVSFDVPYSPVNLRDSSCVFGRCFDYATISTIVDYLFVMDYDIYDEDVSQCASAANSPLPYVLSGLQSYMTLGITPRNLVMGFPWYGYFYKYCLLPPTIAVCAMPFDKFGSCMLDQSRKEIPYSEIINYFMPLVKQLHGNATRDDISASPFLWWFDGTVSNLHHLWYDDPMSITQKIQAVATLNIAGIGIFAASEIDNKNATQVQQMWKPFNDFIENRY